MEEKKIRIGTRAIGEGESCFIIAEAGSNHNGNLEQAKKLIELAKDAGADAVKFQLYTAEGLYSKYTPEFSYLKGKKPFDVIKSIETPRKWLKDLAAYSRDRGIMFLATPFDYEAVDLLDKFVPAFKISSFEIIDLELIRYASEKNKPLIISTGMANLGEIEDAINAAKSTGNEDIILLHCNSVYPAPYEIVNLKAITSMKAAFKLPVGFSDHTIGIHISIAAAARGASVIEKHYTLDRNLPGPDHSFAIEPIELRQMVKNIRDVESSLGDGIKRRSELEGKEMFIKGRRSLHAKIDISKGTKITREIISVKRPGYGIKPRDICNVMGRTAKRNIMQDEWITWDMV